jgi:hypothetical protein
VFLLNPGCNEGLKPLSEHGSIFYMSATEILDELPKLTPAELEIIYRRAVELHRGQTVEASPELLAAIDAADESLTKEGGVSVAEARQIVGSWNTK